jgi:hypothetical protein
LRLELTEREKSFVRFFGFILFILFESWLGFDDFIRETLRAIGYNIRTMGVHAIPRLVSYNYDGLEWALHYSPWGSPSIPLIYTFVIGLMFYGQYHILLRVVEYLRKI